jgi:hypothetical protein
MDWRSVRTSVAACVLLGVVAACSSIQGERLSDPARSEGARFFVEYQVKDTRRLDHQIADALRTRGVAIVLVRDDADYVVTYEDRWKWDMRMYLRDLKIEARDARTGALVGSGRSRQDSFAALGKTHRDVIDRAVAAMFDEQPSGK